MKEIRKIKIAQKPRWFPTRFKNMDIYLAYNPSKEEEKDLIEKGFLKAKHLLEYLEKNYGNKFRLIIFSDINEKDVIIKNYGTLTKIFLNKPKYFEYAKVIDRKIDSMRIAQHFRTLRTVYSQMVPEFFMKGKPTQSLIKEIENSDYMIIEELIREYENLSENERKKIAETIQNTDIGTKIMENVKNLKPESPEIQTKLFIKILDKLGPKQAYEVFNSILKSESWRYFSKTINKFPKNKQEQIIKNIDPRAIIYSRVTKMDGAINEFKRKIKKHMESNKKDENDIHSFLADKFWLLDINYWNQKTLSAIDTKGKQTNDTRTGRIAADFIVYRNDASLDYVVVIEIEEANDKIFHKDGSLSPDVFDGIDQVVMYMIKQKMKNKFTKGVAIIGSVAGMKLSKEQKNILASLNDTYHNIEIVTYDQIIERAKKIVDIFMAKNSPLDKL